MKNHLVKNNINIIHVIIANHGSESACKLPPTRDNEIHPWVTDHVHSECRLMKNIDLLPHVAKCAAELQFINKDSLISLY